MAAPACFKIFAIACDTDAAPVALENGHAENIFEFPNGLRHRRLAYIQLSGGLHHAFLPGNLQKREKVPKFDAVLDHWAMPFGLLLDKLTCGNDNHNQKIMQKA